jgi:dTDP-4-dehydrorhamnose 3,5-epimerase
MRFIETELAGLFVVETEEQGDERGSFVRTFDAAEWTAHGLRPPTLQGNLSRNTHRGTLRGMHYQEQPYSETKLVRCSRGAIFDVVIDLRPESPTFREWFGIELSETNAQMLHIPERFAHGFLTLADASEIVYQMSAPYAPAHARGVRWDDPLFAIEWPARPEVISQRDRSFPDFHP